MSEEYVSEGRTRTDGFSKLYHELFDLYHPYIGDKATLYYLYLLRYKNNKEGVETQGKAWVGRKKVSAEFNMNFAQLKRADAILGAVDLIRIEHVNVGRGRPKFVYFINHPLEKERFPEVESEYTERLKSLCVEDPDVIKMLGKLKKPIFMPISIYKDANKKL